MTTLDKTISVLTDLIGYPSVSSESNLDIINYLSDKIKSLGGKIDIIKTSDNKQANIFATIGPEIDGGIVLSGHTDVVPAKELIGILILLNLQEKMICFMEEVVVIWKGL